MSLPIDPAAYARIVAEATADTILESTREAPEGHGYQAREALAYREGARRGIYLALRLTASNLARLGRDEEAIGDVLDLLAALERAADGTMRDA